MIHGPCKGCHYRHVGCHSDCIGYKNYRTELDRIAENRQPNCRTSIPLTQRRIRVYNKFYGQA